MITVNNTRVNRFEQSIETLHRYFEIAGANYYYTPGTNLKLRRAATAPSGTSQNKLRIAIEYYSEY